MSNEGTDEQRCSNNVNEEESVCIMGTIRHTAEGELDLDEDSCRERPNLR